MTIKEIPLTIADRSEDSLTLENALAMRAEAEARFAEEKYDDALTATVDALKTLRLHSDYSKSDFKAVLAALLFDLAEIHFALKDYKQAEKELETLFRILEGLLRDEADRFGPMHVMAMELSTRILRSRKKTLELLAKQQINTGVLYEKVSAGVAAASDKLVESLRKAAEMMAQTGDYRGAVRFYMEAIKLAKKRSGRVTRREARMTVDMARVMMRSRSEAARARKLLEAVMPHAVALENVELEQEITSLIAKIDEDAAHSPAWKTFMERIQQGARNAFSRSKQEDDEEAAADEAGDVSAETEPQNAK